MGGGGGGEGTPEIFMAYSERKLNCRAPYVQTSSPLEFQMFDSVSSSFLCFRVKIPVCFVFYFLLCTVRQISL